MGTMQAQPGTPQAFENSIRAENATNNCSIENALKYKTWADGLNVGFTSLVVIQTNQTMSDAQEFNLSQVQQMGVNQQSPVYIFGVANNDHFNIGLELLLIAGDDGENSYVKVYNLRNPGSTRADALAALTQVDAVNKPVLDILNAMKRKAGLL